MPSLATDCLPVEVIADRSELSLHQYFIPTAKQRRLQMQLMRTVLSEMLFGRDKEPVPLPDRHSTACTKREQR